MKYKILTLLFITILFTNCKGQTENASISGATFEKITPKLFIDKIYSYENESAQIIDVRTPEEFSKQHLDNAKNININDDSFDTEIAKLDKSKSYWIVSFGICFCINNLPTIS